MSYLKRLLLVGISVCLTVSFVVPSAALAANGGRGGGRGISGRSSRPSFSQRGRSGISQASRPSFFTQSRGFAGRPSDFSSRRPNFTRTSPTDGRGDVRGRRWALERQRTVAVRNREKRRSQAEHLRGISERNGNEQLLDTADRMEQRAEEQYERRVDKINNAYRDLDIPPPPDDGADGTVSSGTLSPPTSPKVTTTKKSRWTNWWPFGRSGR